MTVIEGLSASVYGAAALFLIASGISKVRRPLSTARALYAAGLPSRLVAVQSLGAIEFIVGIAALGAPAVLVARVDAGVVAALYCGFAAFLAYGLVRAKGLPSCGCLGTKDLPPSWFHVGADLLAVGAALLCAVGASNTPAHFLSQSAELGVTWLLLEVVASVAVYHAVLRISGPLNLSRPST